MLDIFSDAKASPSLFFILSHNVYDAGRLPTNLNIDSNVRMPTILISSTFIRLFIALYNFTLNCDVSSLAVW